MSQPIMDSSGGAYPPYLGASGTPGSTIRSAFGLDEREPSTVEQPAQKSRKTNDASINFRVPAHVAEQLRTEAARCDVTVGSLLRKIVVAHFEARQIVDKVLAKVSSHE